MIPDAPSNPPPPVLAPTPAPLLKHKTWSPDLDREDAWLRRKTLHKERRRAGRLSRSVTDEDLEELRGCIDLGFGFEFGGGGGGDSKLAAAFPALDLYYAVNRQYSETMSGDGSGLSDSASSAASSPLSIYSPGDCPNEVKARLKRWAQVVACSVRQRR